MYERTDRQFLEDILESVNAAIDFVTDYDLDGFSEDRKTKSATIRELEIIPVNKIYLKIDLSLLSC